MKYSILLFLYVSLVISSCKKSNVERLNKLPDVSQVGKNTFGCVVNDRIFVPNGGFFYPSSKITISEGKFYILVQHDTEYIFLNFTATDTGITPFCARYRNTETSCEYESCVTGSLIITKLDMKNKIISGVFDFTLSKFDECPDIKVVDGQFDYKFD
ncbi:hypothetical protein [Pedobacter psychroterrae]|uniref:Lipoprotein n=1 Tax=Pedobacter psychroterrae TaxID=2530453 RepID=A0A4R0NQ42_9SPHI|nr:hypothetical protein [Pedobacter psychroterrae]TCD03121.1 hypothetical protein EZ437_03850 [Pedobacter psychroterrae]